MAELAFDTLSVARRLEKEFDFTPKQAEGTAKLVHEQLIGKVATKDDAKALKSDIEKLDKKIDIRAGELNEKIHANTKELNEKIDTSVKELDERIKTVNAGLIGMKTDLIWIRLTGGAIVALLLPLLFQPAMTLLN